MRRGVALPGVNVVEKGTTNGTSTDANGNFSLQVTDENSVLVFSFIGYRSQEIKVGTQTSIPVKLLLGRYYNAGDCGNWLW